MLMMRAMEEPDHEGYKATRSLATGASQWAVCSGADFTVRVAGRKGPPYVRYESPT